MPDNFKAIVARGSAPSWLACTLLAGNIWWGKAAVQQNTELHQQHAKRIEQLIQTQTELNSRISKLEGRLFSSN